MVKERLKTILILFLLISSFVMAYFAWFKSGILGPDWPYFSFEDLPLLRFFNNSDYVSVPKENLSKPRKIVINDGSLWIPYYNTDDAFDTLDEKTSDILKSLLEGKRAEAKKIDYDRWIEYLSSPGVYLEYPIAVEPKMLAAVLEAGFEDLPDEISILKDAIIIPDEEDKVKVALRDANKNSAWEFILEDEELAFPREVLRMYGEKYARDGYYEFAYNTEISLMLAEGNVQLGDLVLFSDNDSTYRDIYTVNPLADKEYGEILKSFSFAPKPLRRYSDKYGAENYVENYATVRIFPNGYIEYSAVDKEGGIDLEAEGGSQYEVLNSAIDFAEKVWSSVSEEQLSVLVSGIEKTATGHKFTFDYYYGGREVAVGLENEGHEPLYHGIEIVTEGDTIISYRQYLRLYSEAESVTKQEYFMNAVDYYVSLFADEETRVITDLYPGYFDGGAESGSLVKTTWLCELNNKDKRYPKA